MLGAIFISISMPYINLYTWEIKMSEYFVGDIVYKFRLDQDKCTRCEVCADICENEAISFEDFELFFNPCRCLKCSACSDECPSGALEMTAYTINSKPYTEKQTQEKLWQINTSCHITCDGNCTDCKK